MGGRFGNLRRFGYSSFVPGDEQDSDLIGELSEAIGQKIPEQFLDFLRAYPNTGMFSAGMVVAQGIERLSGNRSDRYVVNILFASCSDERYDLLEAARQPTYECAPPRYLLQIGEDGGGNVFCLDLRQTTAGRVLFWEQEACSEEFGLRLVAHDFASFVERLTLVPE